MERIECVVIGAGVVGLAVARRLAGEGREVVILEAEDRIGTGVSSRNSEVIHAGIYYPAGSLKAELCVAGRGALYAYCQARGVAHRRCGKLIVATAPEEIEALLQVQSRAQANGVALGWLEADAARRLEPQLRCAAALHSPETGIVDSHGLMKAMLQDAEDGGALLALLSPVLGGRSVAAGIELEVGGQEPTRILASLVYNCAALGAQQVALGIEGLRRENVPPLHLSKGNYFGLSGRSPFSRLVYPVPSSDWLGIHLTLDLAGQARFGPDEEWVDTVDYCMDPARSRAFYASVRRYWPELADDSLQPGYCGIRPKLSGPGGAAQDFLIQRERDHGVPGLVNLFGIDSPGLTACLALAEAVVQGR